MMVAGPAMYKHKFPVKTRFHLIVVDFEEWGVGSDDQVAKASFVDVYPDSP
jgi:hypothetical protein